MTINIINHWILERKNWSPVEIRSLSNGKYQMLGHRSVKGDERWMDLNYPEGEILNYIEMYGRSLWEGM